MFNYRELAKLLITAVLLWGATALLRECTLPGLASLEKAIWTDWVNLSAEHPEVNDVGVMTVEGPPDFPMAQAWAKHTNITSLAEAGDLGAEVLLIPGDTGAVTVTYYLYRQSDGEFVKEISRSYSL